MTENSAPALREVIAKAYAYKAIGDPHARTVHGGQRWEWYLEEADKFLEIFGYLFKTSAAPTDDWTVSASETAREVLDYLGTGSDPSLEPGADRRRDNIAKIITKHFDRMQAAAPASAAEPVAWRVYAKGWGEELLHTESSAKALVEHIRSIAKLEPSITPLYAAL